MDLKLVKTDGTLSPTYTKRAMKPTKRRIVPVFYSAINSSSSLVEMPLVLAICQLVRRTNDAYQECTCSESTLYIIRLPCWFAWELEEYQIYNPLFVLSMTLFCWLSALLCFLCTTRSNDLLSIGRFRKYRSLKTLFGWKGGKVTLSFQSSVKATASSWVCIHNV